MGLSWRSARAPIRHARSLGSGLINVAMRTGGWSGNRTKITYCWERAPRPPGAPPQRTVSKTDGASDQREAHGLKFIADAGAGDDTLDLLALDGRMTEHVRALELYELAQSVLDAKGRFIGVGVLAYKEYRQEHLSIRYWPSTGHLEVWHKRKVLAVNREYGRLTVRHFVPGEWERVLEEAAA